MSSQTNEISYTGEHCTCKRFLGWENIICLLSLVFVCVCFCSPCFSVHISFGIYFLGRLIRCTYAQKNRMSGFVMFVDAMKQQKGEKYRRSLNFNTCQIVKWSVGEGINFTNVFYLWRTAACTKCISEFLWCNTISFRFRLIFMVFRVIKMLRFEWFFGYQW